MPTTTTGVDYRLVATDAVEADDARTYGGAAVPDPETPGDALCIHITDDPSLVTQALEQDAPLDRVPGDLGPGLYCSATPALWMGRSRDKWSFLDELTRGQRARLVRAILTTWQFAEGRYLTTNERQRAKAALLRYVENPQLKYAVVNVADQPYNIRVWEPAFLNRIGIRPGRLPQEVEMRVRGRFARVDRTRLNDDTVEELRATGADGAFSPAGFASSPQLVVWNNRAVRQFGAFKRGPRGRYEP